MSRLLLLPFRRVKLKQDEVMDLTVNPDSQDSFADHRLVCTRRKSTIIVALKYLCSDLFILKSFAAVILAKEIN